MEYNQKACGLNHGLSCTVLGVMYNEGKGVKQSDQKALEHSAKACDLKESLGCRLYAELKKQIKGYKH